MVSVDMLCFLLLCQLVLISFAEHGNGYRYNCPSSFSCGHLGILHYPFTKAEQPHCGLLLIQGCDTHSPKKIQLEKKGPFKWLSGVVPEQQNTITLFDEDFHKRLQNKTCDTLRKSYNLPSPSPLVSFYVKYNVTLFRCKSSLNIKKPPTHYFHHPCPPDYDIYYCGHPSPSEEAYSLFSSCSVLHVPAKDFSDTTDILSFVSAQMVVEVVLSANCHDCCNHKGGQCRLDSNGKFYCDEEPKKRGQLLKLLLGLGIGLGITLLVSGILILRHLFRQKHASSDLQNQTTNTYGHSPYPDPDPENGFVYFSIPLFSYKDLKEATNNFHHTRQLGSGGFGTVYYGKLRDGREVAVKRLYEHNLRRVQQFTNEIEILTRMRHTNLVSLYGCTSPHSHELMLVYEYVPNGTVDCHLHGDLARPGNMPWHTRMKIAIETASSLAYLHASNIIHRDVKTKNILLNNTFSVKVADFGLSKLFPNNVTHASTAPQGTPGYVDPEYHQCYQLTSKSDVYSFGVVLIELISSKPAVDMKRHRDEINLSNLAIKKIQGSALSELVDPCLGCDSDSEVKRMVVSVAELAFQCLQRDKELRPCMDEVLKVLLRIESEHVEEEDVSPPSPPSPDWDENEIGVSEKMMLPASPKAVTDRWVSESTTS